VRSRLLEFLIQLSEKRPELSDNEGVADQVPAETVEACVEQYIFQNCTIKGNASVANQEIKARDINVGGNFVVADRIKDSFKKVNGSPQGAEVVDLIRQLGEAIEAMCQDLPDSQKQEAAQDFDALAVEAAKEEPRKTWVRTAADGLLALSKMAGHATVSGLVAALVHRFGV
jgi:hypothetical protein